MTSRESSFPYNAIWNCMYLSLEVKWLSRVSLFATPWTVTYQAPLSMEFSRQAYCSGLPFPSPGGSSQPRDQTQVSCIAGKHFTIWATRKAIYLLLSIYLRNTFLQFFLSLRVVFNFIFNLLLRQTISVLANYHLENLSTERRTTFKNKSL